MKTRVNCVECAISLTLWLSVIGFVAVIAAAYMGLDSVTPRSFRLEFLFFPLMILNNVVTLMVLKCTTKAGRDAARQNAEQWEELKAILLQRKTA